MPVRVDKHFVDAYTNMAYARANIEAARVTPMRLGKQMLAEQNTNTQPWLAHYEPEVAATLDVPEITLHALFERTVTDYPTSPATLFFGERLTYAQLDEQANKFASGLQNLGVAAGDVVAIILPNCPQFMVALFGTLKAGAIALPIGPAVTAPELEMRLNDAAVKTVVVLNAVTSRVQSILPKTPVERIIVTAIQDALSAFMSIMITVRERRDAVAVDVSGEGLYSYLDLLKNSTAEYVHSPAAPGDGAILLYTSSTAGDPKGVLLTHRNLVANALQMNAWVWDTRPAKHDIYLGAIPLSHGYGLTVVMNLAIVSASCIVLLPRFTLKDVLRAIARWRPTVFPAVPTLYNALARHSLSNNLDLRSLRLCISGETYLPVSIQQDFESVTGARVVSSYGLTESTSTTHCNPVYGERRAGSIGLPLPMTGAQIIHPDTGESLPTGEIGELAVLGPQVMQAYFSHADSPTPVTRDGWLFTGDLAWQDADGYFYLVGRKEDVILVNGMPVYPQEIEDVLYSSDMVRDVVVLGMPSKRRGGVTKVKAYVVLEADADVTAGELRRYVSGKLPPHKVPATIEFRESLPKDISGKHLRRELLAE